MQFPCGKFFVPETSLPATSSWTCETRTSKSGQGKNYFFCSCSFLTVVASTKHLRRKNCIDDLRTTIFFAICILPLHFFYFFLKSLLGYIIPSTSDLWVHLLPQTIHSNRKILMQRTSLKVQRNVKKIGRLSSEHEVEKSFFFQQTHAFSVSYCLVVTFRIILALFKVNKMMSMILIRSRKLRVF